MTTVDKYLNRYLEGSITESEMKEFRDLLESEPHLQTELRQILDLRSLVHDDLLSLNPPESLSAFVRESVGAQFAALGEEEERKRRPVFFTERIAGSLVTAMIALVMIALAPGLITQSVNDDAASGPGIAALENVAPAPSGSSATEMALSSGDSRTVAADEGSRIVRGREFVKHGGSGADRNQLIASESQDPSGALGASATAESNEIDPPSGGASLAATAEESRDDLGVMVDENSRLPERLDHFFASRDNLYEPDRVLSLAIQRNAEPIEEGRSDLNRDPEFIAAALPAIRPEPETTNGSSPRIAFGFTVGAGSLTHSSSSVALTQGAGYAALSLSESNRIGIEAGGSRFRQVHTTISHEIVGKTTPTGLAKRTASADDEWGTIAGGGMVAGVYQIYGTNGKGSQNGGGTAVPEPNPSGSHNGSISLNGDSKEMYAGNPTLAGIGGTPSLPGVSSSFESHTYESDESMGYGMLFYDRRVLEMNDELNIRSRVGVGGTDGGIIVDLRAYAALATNENVAITLGVGGSALRELSRDGKLSANYGVQVGAELGF